MPYWVHALFWSWVGLFGWGGLAIAVASYLGIRDAGAERRRRLRERTPEDWLGVG